LGSAPFERDFSRFIACSTAHARASAVRWRPSWFRSRCRSIAVSPSCAHARSRMEQAKHDSCRFGATRRPPRRAWRVALSASTSRHRGGWRRSMTESGCSKRFPSLSLTTNTTAMRSRCIQRRANSATFLAATHAPTRRSFARSTGRGFEPGSAPGSWSGGRQQALLRSRPPALGPRHLPLRTPARGVIRKEKQVPSECMRCGPGGSGVVRRTC
jgi:hypothetical protein